MPIPRTAILLPVVAIAAMLGGCAEGTSSDEGEPAIIDERQANFEEISDAFKAIRSQNDSDSPDFSLIASNAETINANAQLIGTHFPEGTGMDAGYDTEALATIWQSPDDFAQAADNLVRKSAALHEAASAADRPATAAAIGELGGACKNCHDTFRLDKDD